ncbi:hypothetical protein SmJEL517_g00669 [Synchytrium microbalum]|uniref:Uncharacterized protein n=1 Tax=Synchytrium microbalum TaxID=1806994 RepID=A0A507CEH3_9FUNG|nr:uncharacterized protein SmJEL517_g00669 [Synchytrium microbalum]TPX37758.1 hypothetical protein SmJEL517_g00669 [Synchytrium microbalum]
MVDTGRVSTGNEKRSNRPQKYKNSYAYKNKSTKSQDIEKLPIKGLCRHCKDIIEWRRRYNKYKPLTQPKTCLQCRNKAITDAYHVICNKCANEAGVCAKCRLSETVLPATVKLPEELLSEQQSLEALLASMSERHRRSYLRKMDKGDTEGAEKIVAKAQATNADDEDDFDLEDDLEDEEDEDEDDDEEAESVSKHVKHLQLADEDVDEPEH